MSPPSWRLVAPVNYPGSANKVDGLPGRVGRKVATITDISTRSPHRFPTCRTSCPNSTSCWNCACGVAGCPKNVAAKGHGYGIALCLTTNCN